MRAYRVSAEVLDAGAGTHVTATRFAANQADASAARRAMVEEHGVAFKSVSIEEVNVPTDKAGLIAFLNEQAA